MTKAAEILPQSRYFYVDLISKRVANIVRRSLVDADILAQRHQAFLIRLGLAGVSCHLVIYSANAVPVAAADDGA